MAIARVALVLQGYRPIRPGDPGYTRTSRRQVLASDPSKQLSRREFVNQATRVPLPPSQKAQGQKRKTRSDKGVSKADRNIIRDLRRDLEQQKKQARKQRILEKPSQRVTKKPTSKEEAQKRYDVARTKYQTDHNQPVDDEPEDAQFYDLYDRIKHPNDYPSEEVDDAYRYFYDEPDEYDEDYDYDYDVPLGETP